MGVYSEYLEANLNFQQLTAERKKQLLNISELRGKRDILVFAADLSKGNARIMIGYDDLLPINDQLANLSGTDLDLILETPGGSGEVAEDIVRLLRSKYQNLGVIVPGWAKSAGTIMAMGADEILMEPVSALGPVDAQITWQAKHFSAEALLEGMEKIKKEVQETGVLNKAYIPILQGISPGELQNAQNALDFAERLVKDWLIKYKFKNWVIHSSTGDPVSASEKEERAFEIARLLRSHSQWLTHGRSIKLEDLEEMRLIINDYSQNIKLADAIRRYHALLQITFQTNIYKVIETPFTQIYRFINPIEPQSLKKLPNSSPQQVTKAFLDINCSKCKSAFKLQANLAEGVDLEDGHLPFPRNNLFPCQNCGQEQDLSEVKRQIEAQTKRPLIFEPN